MGICYLYKQGGTTRGCIDTVQGAVLTINDSYHRQLHSLKLFGKTEQFTTMGKNLFSGWKPGGISSTNGEDYSDDTRVKTDFIPVAYDKDIYISGLYDGLFSFCVFYDGEKQYLGRTNAKAYTGLLVKVPYAETRYIRLTTYENVVVGGVISDAPTNVQIEYGSKATAYEPYSGGIPVPNPNSPQAMNSIGDSGAVNVMAAGKNLFNSAVVVERTHNGTTTTVRTDGGVHVSGTATGYRYIKPDDNVFLVLPAGIYTLSPTNVNLHTVENNTLSGTFVLYQETKIANAAFAFKAGEEHNEVAYIQLESGSTATSYKPYKAIQILPISTPNGLHGIPVDSGGNYADENGQQRICDEVDLGRGKRVHRFAKAVFDGSSDEGWEASTTNTSGKYRPRTLALVNVIQNSASNYVVGGIMSNILTSVPSGGYGTYGCNNGISVSDMGYVHCYHDNYNTGDITLWTAYLAENPMTVIYELAEPIETDLTPEEIAAYAAMHTNYPSTTIYNDAGADMAVSYYTK